MSSTRVADPAIELGQVQIRGEQNQRITANRQNKSITNSAINKPVNIQSQKSGACSIEYRNDKQVPSRQNMTSTTQRYLQYLCCGHGDSIRGMSCSYEIENALASTLRKVDRKQGEGGRKAVPPTLTVVTLARWRYMERNYLGKTSPVANFTKSL